MGWAYGVIDGREVGYSVQATCDHPECSAEIDRGLSYFCGNIPGDGLCCGGFFCSNHLSYVFWNSEGDRPRQVCEACRKEWEAILADELKREDEQEDQDNP